MYTTIGYRLRAVGQNPSTSRVAGSMYLSQRYCSAHAGQWWAGRTSRNHGSNRYQFLLAFPTGRHEYARFWFHWSRSCLPAWLNPIGVILSALLLGGLQVGANAMQLTVACPQKNWPLVFKPRFYCSFWVSALLNKEPHFRKKPKYTRGLNTGVVLRTR